MLPNTMVLAWRVCTSTHCLSVRGLLWKNYLLLMFAFEIEIAVGGGPCFQSSSILMRFAVSRTSHTILKRLEENRMKLAYSL